VTEGEPADSVLFIGVGRMGRPIAERLAASGVALAVADLAEEARRPFSGRGLASAAHGADLPGEVVMTMLPTDRHVREALLGTDGALARRPRTAVIDLSTASPAATRELAAELAGRGIGFIDAPVSGGMAGAEAGTLVAMVGGEPETFESCRPLLRCFCGHVTHVGPAGSGHVVKALNNFLSAVTLWSTSEALIIGERLGLDPAAMLSVWTAGTGRSHASEVKLPRHVLTGRYDFGQTLELFCKDIGIASALAAEADVETPALDRIVEAWARLRDETGRQEDITTVARYLAKSRRAG
jgi:3-hydroxyisobutyrate dehydrogenase